MKTRPGTGAAPRPTPNPEKQLLGLLGLAARARKLVPGTDRVRDAVRGGSARRVLLARDAAPAQRDKLLPLLKAMGVPHHTVLGRDQLGAAIGKGPISAIAVLDAGFARRVGELVGGEGSPQSSS